MCPGSAQRQRTGTGIHIGRCRWDTTASAGTAAVQRCAPQQSGITRRWCCPSCCSSCWCQCTVIWWRRDDECGRNNSEEREEQSKERERESERQVEPSEKGKRQAIVTDSHCDNNFFELFSAEQWREKVNIMIRKLTMAHVGK